MLYKFLLIDDDWDDRNFFSDALAKVTSEASCIALEDGHEMMPGLITVKFEKPDIVFLDLNMPIISGWDCLSLLKKHEDYNDILVILYSTSKHTEEIARAKAEGAICFFNKPNDFGILKQAINELLNILKK